MKHDHAAFAGIGHNQGACRLCGCTDRDGLIERLAAELWDSRQIHDYVPWEQAGELWHKGFRELAETAIDSLSASPACQAG